MNTFKTRILIASFITIILLLIISSSANAQTISTNGYKIVLNDNTAVVKAANKKALKKVQGKYVSLGFYNPSNFSFDSEVRTWGKKKKSMTFKVNPSEFTEVTLAIGNKVFPTINYSYQK